MLQNQLAQIKFTVFQTIKLQLSTHNNVLEAREQLPISARNTPVEIIIGKSLYCSVAKSADVGMWQFSSEHLLGQRAICIIASQKYRSAVTFADHQRIFNKIIYHELITVNPIKSGC